MRWVRFLLVVVWALCVFGTPALHAADLTGHEVTLGGFGTLAGTYQDANNLEFRRTIGQPRGAEDGNLQLGTDSIAGLQVNARWDQSLEAVLQGTTRLNADNTWRPRISRAFLRYLPDEAVMLRAGRLGYDIYLHADSRDVGYSSLPIRPPVEVYGVVPNDDFDGLDATLTHPLGPGLAKLKLYAGLTSSRVVQNDGSISDLSDSKVWGGYLGYQYRGWEFRLSAGSYLLSKAAPVDPLISALRFTGVPDSIALADELAKKGRRTNYVQASVAYDDGPLQAEAFVARLDADSAPGPKLNLGYALVGYRLGKFTPYTSYAAVKSFADILPTGLPDVPLFAALNAAAQSTQTALQATQHTLSFGVRYDIAPKMDIKAQVDRVWLRQSNLVLDHDVPPLSRATMTVFGLAFDFVF